MASQIIGDGGTDGTTLGPSSSSKVSFYNVTPVVQPADAVETTITVSWIAISSGFGIDTSDHMVSLIATFKHIQYVLKTLGLWKGTA